MEEQDTIRGVDILHPIAKLHWQQCYKWEKFIYPTCCSILPDLVCLLRRGFDDKNDKLYIFSTDFQLLVKKRLLYQNMTLATYQSKLVAVGGRNPCTREVTNKLCIYDRDGCFQQLLPSMPTKRCDTSAIGTETPQLLMVAGGLDSQHRALDVVEVLVGEQEQWITVDCLPKQCCNMNSTFHDGNLSFMGGEEEVDSVFCCTLDSLILACKQDGCPKSSELWNQFKAPCCYTTTASYGRRLISIEECSIINAYSSTCQSWKKVTSVGDVPSEDCHSAAVVLSTGDLIVARGDGVFVVSCKLNYWDAYCYFLNERESLKFLPHVDKNAACLHLTEEITNVWCAGEQSQPTCTSDASESGCYVMVRTFSTATVLTKSEQSLIKNLMEEAQVPLCDLFKMIENNIKPISANAEKECSVPSSLPVKTVGENTKSQCIAQSHHLLMERISISGSLSVHSDSVSNCQPHDILKLAAIFREVVGYSVSYSNTLISCVSSEEATDSNFHMSLEMPDQHKLELPKVTKFVETAAMDNTERQKEKMDEIRVLLEEGMKNYSKKLTIPAIWLLLNVFLHMGGVSTASLKSCMQLAEQLKMSTYETQVALWFLHHHAGVLMYFPSIEDSVIINKQVVLDSITILFFFLAKARAVTERFWKTGIFSMEDLKAAATSGDCILLCKLVALLEFLHIVARLSNLSLTSASDAKNMYIMPCMLKNANIEELDSLSHDSISVAPLKICFKRGLVPIGVFSALIASFIGSKCLNLKLILQGIKKNIVQFYFDGDNRVAFIARSKYYEICMLATKRPLYEVCSALRKVVELTIKRVSSRLNYGCFKDYQFSFECPIDSDKEHLCLVDTEVSPLMMRCLHNPNKPEPLQNHQIVWFEQPLPKNSSPQVCAKDKHEDNMNVFLKMFPKLVKKLQWNVSSFADLCWSDGLICEDTYLDVLQLKLSDADKARKVLVNVKGTMSEKEEALTTFMTILCGMNCDILVEEMKKLCNN